ncbi:hypothetical protein SNEBB_007806 [Seison nebaliae]|nr:hypothetical protein SNEBB_007806 [Seison nebaliae]
MLLYGEYLFILHSLELIPLNEMNNLITTMMELLWKEQHLSDKYDNYLEKLNDNDLINDLNKIWKIYMKCHKGLLANQNIIESVAFDNRLELYEMMISSDVSCNLYHHFSSVDLGGFIFHWKWLNRELKDINLLKKFLLKLAVNENMEKFLFNFVNVNKTFVTDARIVMKNVESKILNILQHQEKENISTFSLPESPISLTNDKTNHVLSYLEDNSFTNDRNSSTNSKYDNFELSMRKQHKKRKRSSYLSSTKAKSRKMLRDADSFDFNSMDIDDIMNDPCCVTEYDICYIDPFDLIIFNGFNRPTDRLFMVIFPYGDTYQLSFVDNREGKRKIKYESPSGIYPFIPAPDLRHQIYRHIKTKEQSLSYLKLSEERKNLRRKFLAKNEFSKSFRIVVKKESLPT